VYGGHASTRARVGCQLLPNLSSNKGTAHPCSMFLLWVGVKDAVMYSRNMMFQHNILIPATVPALKTRIT
jgi:hypothetical protein